MSNTSKEQSDIKVLKKATCKTLSGKSTLTYHVGADSDDEIHVRVHANTGGGFFSNEWVSMKDIQAVLEEHLEGTPVTSFILQPLFHGKSVNTPAFLLAALAHEKLLRSMKGKQRHHEIADDFMAVVDGLTSSKTKATVRKKAPTKKAAVKKRSATRRKKATT